MRFYICVVALLIDVYYNIHPHIHSRSLESTGTNTTDTDILGWSDLTYKVRTKTVKVIGGTSCHDVVCGVEFGK